MVDEVAASRARNQENAVEVDVHNLIPFVVGDFGGFLMQANTGVIEYAVQIAETVEEVRKCTVNILGGSDVALEGFDLCAVSLRNFSRRLFGKINVHIENADFCAAVRHRFADSLADALRTAGDNNFLSLQREPIHK